MTRRTSPRRAAPVRSSPLRDAPSTTPLCSPPRRSARTLSFHALAVLALSAIQAVSAALLAALAHYQRLWATLAATHAAARPAPRPHAAAPALTLAGELLGLRTRRAGAVLLSFARVAEALAAPLLDRYARVM